MPIDNEQDLTRALQENVANILTDVSDGLLEKLSDDGGLIETIVYDAGEPTWYERQGKDGGILDLFDKEVSILFNGFVESKITEFPNRLRHSPESFIHGSYWWIDDDIRNILVDMIIMGTAGPLFGDGFWREPRDFWSPFLNYVDKNIYKIFEKKLRDNNFLFKRG